MADISIKIEGMSCQHCVMRVEKAINGLDGVESSSVSIGAAEVQFDESKTGKGAIEAAIQGAGYRVVK